VPMNAICTLSTGPSAPTARLQSMAAEPFHWFFLAVSYRVASSSWVGT
jgi:hypothetical protein